MLRYPKNDCEHTWVTRSETKYYVSCPFCRKGVHTVRDRVGLNEGSLDKT